LHWALERLLVAGVTHEADIQHKVANLRIQDNAQVVDDSKGSTPVAQAVQPRRRVVDKVDNGAGGQAKRSGKGAGQGRWMGAKDQDTVLLDTCVGEVEVQERLAFGNMANCMEDNGGEK
jgi:hypothetical protein